MRKYNIVKKGDNYESVGRKAKYDLKSLYQQQEEATLAELKKKKRIRLAIVTVLVLIPCIAFGAIMYSGYVKTNRAYSEIERDYTNLAMSYVSEDEEVGSILEDKNMAKYVDFESLTTKESDIYSWISIPKTSIDYPILQSSDDKDDDYWLNHNLDGTTGYPGTIFTEKMFGKDFKTFNTVIYGHDMKNQTMFGELRNFEKSESYFNENEYVYVYTKYMTYKYQIVCASTISDIHLANAYNGYNTENQRQKFLEYITSNAKYSRNTEIGIYDSYITLSTCTASDKNRFVVLAKCVDKVSNRDYD